jgi:hypothetical protein
VIVQLQNASLWTRYQYFRWCLERWGIRRGLLVGQEGDYYWNYHAPGLDLPQRMEQYG